MDSAETVAIRSPSHPDGEPVGFAELADGAGARRAVDVATSGLAAWAATPLAERGSILRRAADLLEARGHEFAAWIVHEGGRDRAGAWTEVEEGIDFLRYYAGQAEALFRDFAGRIAPRGVVAVIPPWNFPLAIPCGMTAAALACGNAAILKPAEQTPLLGLRLAALLHEAGVPRDALIALPGRGETAGAALAESPGVAMVAFTGSRAVGTLLHEAVARVAPVRRHGHEDPRCRDGRQERDHRLPRRRPRRGRRRRDAVGVRSRQPEVLGGLARARGGVRVRHDP